MDIENKTKQTSFILPFQKQNKDSAKQNKLKLSKLSSNINQKPTINVITDRYPNKLKATQLPNYQHNLSNQISFVRNLQNDQKNITHLGFLSPRVHFNTSRDKMINCGYKTTQNSFIMERNIAKQQKLFKQKQKIKCHNCQKLEGMLWQQKYEKQTAQNKSKEFIKKYEIILKQKAELQQKIAKIQQKLQKTKITLQPYKNSVNFMQQHLDSIKQSLTIPKIQANIQPPQIHTQLTQQNRNLSFQIYLLQKSHAHQNQSNNWKINRLNLLLTNMQAKNKQIQKQIYELTHKNKILNSIIHQGSYVNQLKQLFSMASQEAYQLKIMYTQSKKQKQNLLRLVQKLRGKIYMLTSLIGYGVVSNIQNNDLPQIRKITQNILNTSKTYQKLTLDIYGLQSIKNYKESYSQIKQSCKQQQTYNCLYQANFLVMFDDQQIKNTLQENITTIIKPQFFLLIRAILDSKFQQFIIQKQKSNKFSEFAYTFIQCFKIKKNTKRIQINKKLNNQQNGVLKTNFLLRIFDRKIGHLPQILTFREFLIQNIGQDQVFYYLMCRNFIYDGPELDNYINCSDTYNFVSYPRVLQILQHLLADLDRNCKIIIFNHINNKKVMKNKKLLIKSNYVLRLLLQVYRKIKKQRIGKLRLLFEQTCRSIKSNFLKFIHFKDLLRKNFTSLTNSDIAEYYRKTMSIFHTHNQTTFFQAFNATSSQKIFISQNFLLHQQLKQKIYTNKSVERCNYLLQLIPQSISQIGNENLYQQYISYIKLKGLNLENRIKISIFLLKIINIGLFDIQRKEIQRQYLQEVIDELNNKLIDYVNKNFKRRQKYEESLEKASSFIGKQVRKKIYEFYSQFIKDIKNQTSN